MNAATFSLGQLWPLWLLVALPLLVVTAWRHRSHLGRGRMLTALLLRSAALALLALALARPELHRGIRDVSLVYAIDVSRSVSPAFLRSALDWMQEANRKGNPAQVRYVAFADRAVMVDSIAAVESLAVSEGATEGIVARDRSEPRRTDRSAGDLGGPAALDQGATNLERALATSLSGFAPGHALRLVLLSDGNQTEGDLWRVVPRLRRQGVRVFGVPAAVAVTRDAWVEGVEATDGIRQQEPATVNVRVFSRMPGPARIELKVAGVATGARDVTLTEGRNEFAFDTEFKQAGRNTIEARVAAEGDQVPDNDTLTQQLWVGARPRVLYVESSPPSARYLRDALGKQGIDVTVVAPAALAADPPPYQGHDAVLLSDLPAEAIGETSARRLEAFVRDGGALLFAAGENTFGEQGFRRGTIEGLLPVTFEGRRKKKELDLVLLIDRSHSMSGKKLEFAKTAALSTLDLLEEQHRLAVIAFDAQPHEVVPLAEVGNKRRAEDQISGMAAGGQTGIFNALVYARRLLKDSPAKTKHVILLSDGQTMPAGRLDDNASAAVRGDDKPRQATPYDRFMAEQPKDDGRGNAGFEEIATRMAAEKVTISTVTVGEQPNLELMQSLARWGKGKSQVAASETEIPSLFVGEARRLMRESIVEEPFRPVVKTSAEALAGLQFAKAPPLKGFVVARAKPFSETLLEAKDHQPLLVQTHHGLGRTVAFLSDVKNRWASDWLGWDGYGKLWAQVVRASIRRDTGEELALRVARQGHEAIVTLTALEPDGRYRDRLSPKLRVTAPDGGRMVLAMSQLGPGRYQARVPLRPSQAAPYGFELIETAGITAEQLTKAAPASFFYGHTDEYRVLPADESLLRAVSIETGGRFMPKTEEIFAVDRDSGQVSRALWQFCAAAALLAFLLDLLVRRMPGRR
jgi:uncharacterized membrane protein